MHSLNAMDPGGRGPKSILIAGCEISSFLLLRALMCSCGAMELFEWVVAVVLQGQSQRLGAVAKTIFFNE